MSDAYVLVVDDEPDIRELVREILEDEGYEVAVAEDATAAREALRSRRPDLVLLDIWMPDVDGITLLKEWSREGELPFPVIVMSGHGTVETAVEATRLGAYDFLEKPLSLAKLLLTVERALETEQLRRENVGLRRRAQPVSEPIGRSPVMQQLREQARRLAAHDAWALIGGEAGSGKRTLARYIHLLSARRQGPFVELAGSALARDRAAAELFGVESADGIHYGALEQASGGVLFLDEVADIDPETQARLLNALETQSFVREGGLEPVRVNVRVLAASSRDLAAEVAAGRFRQDLYYRLNVVPLVVPPLREHCEDVPELLAHYVDQFVSQDHLPYRSFSVAAQNRLRNYSWPGNVRELKNLVQRLLILGSGERIELEEVEAALRSTTPAGEAAPVALFELPLREAREAFEREYLRQRLEACGGSVGRLAKLAGMERTNLYRKLKALGISVGQK